MDGKIVQEFSQLRVLPQTSSANRNQSSSNRRSLVVELCPDERKGDEGITRMDALVQDLNSALEESTRADMMRHQNGDISNVEIQQHQQNSKRRAWRRRCKSTSNLASIASKTTSKVSEKLSKGATRNIVATTEPSTEMGSLQNDNSNETGTQNDTNI